MSVHIFEGDIFKVENTREWRSKSGKRMTVIPIRDKRGYWKADLYITNPEDIEGAEYIRLTKIQGYSGQPHMSPVTHKWYFNNLVLAFAERTEPNTKRKRTAQSPDEEFFEEFGL